MNIGGGLTLLLRALWWRRGLSLAILLVAAITVGAGSLGPLYARAADESTLRDRLNASAKDTALHYTFVREISTDSDLADAESQGPKPGSIAAYPTTQIATVMSTVAIAVTSAAAGGIDVHTRLIWRDGACGHFVMVSGRCPRAPGEVVVSDRTLQDDHYGWKIGTELTLPDVQRDDPTSGGASTLPITVRIVGSYRLRDAADPFWQDRGYFDAHPGAGDGADTVDGLFADRSELGALAKPTTMQVQVDYPLAPDRVRLAGVASLRHSVQTLQLFRSQITQDDTFTTALFPVLDAARSEQRLVNVSTLLVSLQLAVLAWLVLFQVIADAVEAKGSEIALAKLRGLRPSGTVRFGLAEPLLLVALATPIGLLAGWIAVRLFAATVLAPDTPVTLTRATFIAVAASLAGSVVAAVGAGRRTLRRSVLEQWRRTPGHHPSRLMLALDLLLAVAAIAGLVLLHRTATGSNPQSVALLAPGLLVFAVALLGIRLLPLVLRPLLPATRATRRIGLFLAARQVVRRPAGLRLAALLAVAVGLATFAIAGEGVDARNREARARVEVGAPATAPVQFEPLHDPVAATRRADPDGKWAMATASWLPDGGGSVTGQLLAVDASRLAAVGYSGDTELSTAAIAKALVPPSVPPAVQFKASALRVTVTASGLSAGNRPLVLLNLRKPGQPQLGVRAGQLSTGEHVYTAQVPCTDGCTLGGLTWDRPIDTFGDLSGTTLVSRIEQQVGGRWQPLPADLSVAAAWRRATQAGNASDALSITNQGVQDVFTSRAGGSAGIAHSDSPRPLLMLASRNGVIHGSNGAASPEVSDDTQTAAAFRVVGSPAVLPSVLDNGVLVDLTALRVQLPAFDIEASWSIWLGPQAPPDALDRLRAAGLVVQAGDTQHARVAELARQGPALALRLLVVCAIAGSVLAVGGTAIAIASTGRRRSFELASLRAIGIRARTLLRASIAEQLLLLGASLVLGVPAGYLAARLSMPSIPEFADPTPVALHFTPAALGVLLFALVFAILLSLTAVVAGRALMRAAAPSRLREAE